MSFLVFEDLKQEISDIIHEDTQQHGNHIDLTVKEVFRVTGAGSLDFGGSEFNPATSEKITPEKQKQDDDYGWWKLGQGPYKIIFNETLNLKEDHTAIISPHTHARKAGLISDSFIIPSGENEDDLSMNITISEAGCNIKENARIAELRILES
jgi:hypothetical protein